MASAELELLRRYIEGRDMEAFRLLVEEHSGMVYAVCKRILRDTADAEDAAQNAFFQLARKAAGLKPPIAGWLHRVAVNVALNMQKKRAVRQAHESHAAAVRATETDPAWEDVIGAVDEVIADLPDHLRAPVVMHYLEGRKQEDVAAALGISQPSVSKRLAQGIEILRKRLKKSGVIASSAAFATLLAAHSAEAAPPSLTANIGKMAFAGLASGTKAAATLGGMAAAKWGIVTAVATAAIVTGGVVAQKTLSVNDRAQPAAVVQPTPMVSTPPVQPLVTQATPSTAPRTKAVAQALTGNVLLPDGKPAAGATVKLYYLHDDSGYGSKWLTETKADAQGKFSMTPPSYEPPALLVGRLSVRRFFLAAYQPGYAPAVSEVDPRGETPQYTLKLTPGRNVLCTVLDEKKKPVKDATVEITHPQDAWDSLNLLSLSYEIVGCIAPEIFGRGRTDESGHVTLKDVPVCAADLRAYHSEKGLGRGRIGGHDAGAGVLSVLKAFAGRDPSQVTICLEMKAMPLTGQVTLADTGKAAAGMIVCGGYVSWSSTPSMWWSTTDAEGKFTLRMFEGTGRWETVAAFDPSRKPEYASTKFGWWGGAAPAEPVTLTMERGTPLVVTTRNVRTGQAVSGAVLQIWLPGEGITIADRRIGDAKGECAFCLRGVQKIRVDQAPPGYLLLTPTGEAEGPFTEENARAELDVDVIPGVNLPVTVKLPDGRTTVNLRVAVQQPGIRIEDLSCKYTGYNGHVLLKDLPLGRDLTIYAFANREGRSAAAKFDWRPTPNPKPVEITLKPVPLAEIVLQDDKGNRLQRHVTVQLVDGPPFAWNDTGVLNGRAGLFVSGLLPDTDYLVWLAGIQVGNATADRNDFVPEGQWRFSKDDQNPKLILTYDPNRRRGAPESPKPRTEEDFKKDCASLSAASQRADPIQTEQTWYVLKEGLALANAKTFEVKRFTELLGETDFVVSGIAFGKDKVWVGTNKGLFAWDRKDMFWTRFAVDGKFTDLPVKELSLTDASKRTATGKPAAAGKLLVTIEQEGRSRNFEYDFKAMTWQESP